MADGDKIVLRSFKDKPWNELEVEVDGEAKMYRLIAPVKDCTLEDGGLFLTFDLPRKVELRQAIARGYLRPLESDGS